MKKFVSVLLSAVLALSLCSCSGNKESTPKTQNTTASINLDGIYVTDMAYGMEYFNSEIEIKGTDFKLWIEHFGDIVEEYEGTFTLKDNVLTMSSETGEQTFMYSAEEQTLYNEEMETTWTIKERFVPSKTDEQSSGQDDRPEAPSDEPDPIPESVQGTYVYSDNMMKATLTIGINDYELHAVSSAAEPLEVKGAAVYAGVNLLLLEDGNSVTCPYDESTKTIEYSGYIFTKE